MWYMMGMTDITPSEWVFGILGLIIWSAAIMGIFQLTTGSVGPDDGYQRGVMDNLW